MESHLAAPKAMLTLVKGGLIRAQVEWIDSLIRDSRRTTVVLCALPEEMPVIEAIELNDRLRKRSGVAVDLCLLNRAVDEPVTAAHRRLMSALIDPEHADAVAQRLGGSPGAARGRYRPSGPPARHHDAVHAPAPEQAPDARGSSAVHRRSDRADDHASGRGSAQRQIGMSAGDRGHIPERRRSARGEACRTGSQSRFARGRDLLRQRGRRQDNGERRAWSGNRGSGRQTRVGADGRPGEAPGDGAGHPGDRRRAGAHPQGTASPSRDDHHRRGRGSDARHEAGVGPDDRALLARPRDGAGGFFATRSTSASPIRLSDRTSMPRSRRCTSSTTRGSTTASSSTRRRLATRSTFWKLQPASPITWARACSRCCQVAHHVSASER